VNNFYERYSLTVFCSIVFMGLATLFPTTYVRAAEYEIKGDITTSYIGHHDPESPPYEKRSHFVIAVSNSDWQIRILPESDPATGTPPPPEAIISPLPEGNVLTWVFKKNQRFFGRSLIIERQVPCFGFVPESAFVWFAYASSTWLDAQTNIGKLERINLLGAPSYMPGDKAELWKAVYSRSPQSPCLPQSATWMPLGKTNVVYSVTSWEQIGGLNIPTEWSFGIYGAKSRYSTDTVETHHVSVQGIVVSTNCTLVLTGHPPYPESGSLQIFDFRFANDLPVPIDQISYQVSNAWYTKEEVKQMPLFAGVQYAAERRASQAAMLRSPKTARVFLGILVFIFIIPFFAVLRKFVKQQITTKNTL
jgi:hypothetical protein